MLKTKRIVILANSKKHWTSAEHNGRCVAGIARGKPRTWIRPVSARTTQEVSFHERKYQGELEPELLDVVDVPVVSAVPSGHQQENWLIDPEEWWEKVGDYDLGSLSEYATLRGPLWVPGSASAQYENNRVPTGQMDGISDSLRLIRVPRFEVGARWVWGKKHVDGRFTFDGIDYVMRVTDPWVEAEYWNRKAGWHDRGECYLTISLGESYGAYFYKFIAGVIDIP